MAHQTIDAKGLQCPAPIMRLFNWAKSAQPGDEVSVEATDAGFCSDVAAWAKKTGNTVASLQEDGGVITAIIRKGAA